MPRHASRRRGKTTAEALGIVQANQADVSLLDVIDHLLNQGVVVSGEVMIGVADVNLIYVRLLALVCSADRAEASGASWRPVPAASGRR